MKIRITKISTQAISIRYFETNADNRKGHIGHRIHRCLRTIRTLGSDGIKTILDQIKICIYSNHLRREVGIIGPGLPG